MDGFGSAAAWLFRAGRRDVYYLRCASGQRRYLVAAGCTGGADCIIVFGKLA